LWGYDITGFNDETGDFIVLFVGFLIEDDFILHLFEFMVEMLDDL
jgi:hypothetical protein